MFQIISGTSKTVSGTQNLERIVPNTAHKNVPDIGTLFLLVFPAVNDCPGNERNVGDLNAGPGKR